MDSPAQGEKYRDASRSRQTGATGRYSSRRLIRFKRCRLLAIRGDARSDRLPSARGPISQRPCTQAMTAPREVVRDAIEVERHRPDPVEFHVHDEVFARVGGPGDLCVIRQVILGIDGGADSNPRIVWAGRYEHITKQAAVAQARVPLAVQATPATDDERVPRM